ncbi:MAG: cytochrome c-type biogenesis protein [Pseudomonadota bacterium]
MRRLIACALLTLSLAPACAAEAQPVAPDPVLEKRVMALSEELRCLVCQNQTIADSHAELAIDLRNQVREQLAAGRSEQQVTDYMVQRYGDFVLYRPPVKGLTWLLWFGPFALLAGGLLLLLQKLRRPRAAALEPAPLDIERAAQLLGTQTTQKEMP